MNYLPSNCPNNSYTKTSVPLVIFSLVIVVSLTSCARKPWRESLQDSERLAVTKALNDIREGETSRSNCVDADLNIFFTSHLKNRAVSGYVQIMQPSYLKFIVSNPLGQPLFAFTTDGSQFNQLDTSQQQFLDGDLQAFARIYDTPAFVYNRSWGKWLTARLPESELITEIRFDSEERGSWVTIVDQNKINTDNHQKTATEHLLIDSDNSRLLSRIFTTESGDIEAELTYSDWSPENRWQPGKITIEGLDYGSKIVLDFTDVSDLEYCRTADFQLRRPTGYQHIPVWENLY